MVSRMMAFRSLSVISVMIVTHSLNAAEDVVINMQAAPTDPLVEMMWPPSGSPDRYDFTDEGLVIEQQGDSIGDPVGVIGLRTMIPAQGDFEIKLDLKVTKLQPPTSGWGQGMVFAVFLDDQEETILKLNQVCILGQAPISTIEISGRGVKDPKYSSTDPLSEGTLSIARVDEEAIFRIDDGTGFREVYRSTCPKSDMRSVEVICTRLPEGNTPVELTLKKLTITADSFYTFRRPEESWFSVWKLLIAVQVILVIALLAYKVKRG